MSYWGNLAQFGLYPNGRGGVGPSPNVGSTSVGDQLGLRPQNLAVGNTQSYFFLISLLALNLYRIS